MHRRKSAHSRTRQPTRTRSRVAEGRLRHEFLEIDTLAKQSAHVGSVGESSIDNRGAKLVERALDVEGFTAMDVLFLS